MSAFIVCPVCGAQSSILPPHGSGNPCPMKVAEQAKLMEVLEAQRLAYARDILSRTGGGGGRGGASGSSW